MEEAMKAGRAWKGLVFIGTSVDGQVARADGTLDWLLELGEAAGDAGYTAFMAGVDAVLMGRATYEVARDFVAWPYPDLPVTVLSTTLTSGEDARIRVARSLAEADRILTSSGARGVYIDGATTVRTALAAGLVDELTISRVPVLIGDGIPLFRELPHDVRLIHEGTSVLGGGMVQTTYRVDAAAEIGG